MPARACLFALVVVALAASGCSSSVCPFPNTSSVAIEPAEPCLQATLASCVRPTLNIVNKCPEALYMPIDYGVFAADAMAGSEVEVLTNATIQYEVRDDKAVTKTATRKDFEIPARLGSNKITLRFNTSS